MTDADPSNAPSEILERQLAVKKTRRKKQTALPMAEKAKVVEKLRAQNQAFRGIRKRRGAKSE
jgi:hypothetical protein